MKKFFCAIFSFVLVSLLCFTGCSDGWTEVQSITYAIGSYSTTYTSTFYMDISTEFITKEEYQSILESGTTSEFHIREFNDITNGVIPVDRESCLSEYTVGKTYLARNKAISIEESIYLYKFTVNKKEFRYVKIKFVDNDCLEISYYDDDENKTVKVKPTSYKITYFED